MHCSGQTGPGRRINEGVLYRLSSIMSLFEILMLARISSNTCLLIHLLELLKQTNLKKKLVLTIICLEINLHTVHKLFVAKRRPGLVGSLAILPPEVPGKSASTGWDGCHPLMATLALAKLW